jgi:thioredoxin-related protein
MFLQENVVNMVLIAQLLPRVVNFKNVVIRKEVKHLVVLIDQIIVGTNVAKILQFMLKIFLDKYLSLLLLVISVTLNIFLAKEVNRLNKEVEFVSENQKLVLGEVADSIDVVDINDLATVIQSENEKPTVLYIFSPDCYWCEKGHKDISFINEFKNAEYRIIGISLKKEELTNFIKDKNYKFPIFHSPSDSTKLRYNLYSTPQTIVLSKKGEVLKIWRGAFTSAERQEEVNYYFNIKLPSLSD